MIRKVILTEVEKIETYPPVISVLNCLAYSQDIEVILCAVNVSTKLSEFCYEHGVKIYNIEIAEKEQNAIYSRLFKYANYSKIKQALWRVLEKEMCNESIIWVFSIVTLKYLGSKLLKTKYVLHLFELVEKLTYSARLPYPELNLKLFCQKAYRVIECEYNRAHITKVWFDLSELPVVLPNKLFLPKEPEYNGNISSEQQALMSDLSNKKIILYQGVISPERPLDAFINGVRLLGDDYIMLIMSGNKNTYKQEKNVCFCSYIPAPYHLYVTQRAYIGILCYIASPKGYSYTSSLNSIYCAPNKIFEYARYGIPMIGNNIPGLTCSIERYSMGKCVQNLTAEDVAMAIRSISDDYEKIKENTLKYYNSIDIKNIIYSEILN